MTRFDAISYKVNLIGRVQGVSFRDWTVRQAIRLAISGWIRNLEDGSVEAVISGSPQNIQKMLSVIEVGPLTAHVASISCTPCSPPVRSGFRKLSTHLGKPFDM